MVKCVAPVIVESYYLRDISDSASSVGAGEDDDEIDGFGNESGLRRHVGALREPIESAQCSFSS